MVSVIRRDGLAAVGIALVAVGLAHRMAFWSGPGLVLLLSGFVLLGIAQSRPRGGEGAYPVLLVLLCVVAAMAPFDPSGPNAVEAVLTVGAGLAFYTFGILPGTARFRLGACGALLVLAHAHYLLRFPHPLHQDVWTFLNRGADLLASGHNPYLGVSFVEEGVNKTVPYTYPPGALLELAPFRLLLGDVRWAYVMAEAAVVAMWAFALRRAGGRQRWREALVLLPLALPRTSQAFYIFSNHEWELLALGLAVLLLATDRRVLAAGLVAGLGIASKQYFLLFPALFLLPVLRPRSLVIGILLAALVVAPFLVWSPADFLRDVFGNLSQGVASDRLTLWAALDHAGVHASRAVQVAVLGLVLLAGLAGAWRARRDLARSLVLCGLSLAAFAFVSTFAAYNYYAYALVFVTWGLLLPPVPASPGGARPLELAR